MIERSVAAAVKGPESRLDGSLGSSSRLPSTGDREV